MAEEGKMFGEEKIPKCQYCSNRLDEGAVQNFLVIWNSSDLAKPDVLACGDICTPCCNKKKDEVENILQTGVAPCSPNSTNKT